MEEAIYFQEIYLSKKIYISKEHFDSEHTIEPTHLLHVYSPLAKNGYAKARAYLKKFPLGR